MIDMPRAQQLHLCFKSIRILVLGLLCLMMEVGPASADTWRLYLRNKGISPFIEGSELYSQTKALLSPRCLARRAKVLPKDSLISLEDAPLYRPYLDNIVTTGATILQQLRWKNYVVVSCDSAVALKLKSKSYVRDITLASEFFKTLGIKEEHVKRTPHVALEDSSCGLFRYGPSRFQNQLVHSPEFHRMGELGSQCLLGIIDNGFRYPAHDCFNQMNKRGAYDFVFNDSTVYNDSLDIGNQDAHGTGTLSVIAAWQPDSLIGIAPAVQVMMAKTEDMRSETHVEEDNYAAAIEWLEAAGVDLTTSSVGYRNLDSLQQSYPYSMLDGKNTICDMALNRATRLGVVCCTAAGNEGGSSETLITPGDADSAITVGAVSDDSLHTPSWTSKGPSASGSLKPDVATLGVNVIGAKLGSRTEIGLNNGTSFATPTIAGGIALLLSQFPELRPYEVRTLLYRYSSNTLAPNNVVGYGVPNFMEAAMHYGIVISPLLSYPAPTSQYFVYSMRSALPLTSMVLSVSFDNGSTFSDYPLEKTSTSDPDQYYARVPRDDLHPMVYSLQVRDAGRTRRIPATGYASLRYGDQLIPCGMDPATFPSDVNDEFSSELADIPTAIAFGTPSLRVYSSEKTICVSVHDALGHERVKLSAVSGLINITTSTLERGLYSVSLQNGARHNSQVFLVY